MGDIAEAGTLPREDADDARDDGAGRAGAGRRLTAVSILAIYSQPVSVLASWNRSPPVASVASVLVVVSVGVAVAVLVGPIYRATATVSGERRPLYGKLRNLAITVWGDPADRRRHVGTEPRDPDVGDGDLPRTVSGFHPADRNRRDPAPEADRAGSPRRPRPTDDGAESGTATSTGSDRQSSTGD